MKFYSTYLQAVIGLHERGFTEDFIQSGNTLVWIQQQVLLQPNDFQVLERYHFHLPEAKVYTVLAVVLKSVHAKGILISQQLIGNRSTASGKKQLLHQILHTSFETLTISPQ